MAEPTKYVLTNKNNPTDVDITTIVPLKNPDGSYQTDDQGRILAEVCICRNVRSMSADLNAKVEKVMKSGGVPVGAILPWSSPLGAIPESYLLCNGAAVSRTNYADLFAAIGTTYGVGNNSTTFNLPDLRGRFLEGANGNCGSYARAGLPNVRGQFSEHGNVWHGAVYATPPFNFVSYHARHSNTNTGGDGGDVVFDLSTANGIYGASGTVQPAAVRVQYLIKY